MGTRLEHKTALVTGATSNIGRAIVTAFAAEGAQVVVSGRSRERGAEVVGEIRSAGAAPTSWPPTSTALRRPPGTWARRRPACSVAAYQRSQARSRVSRARRRQARDAVILLSIRDDGVGGADPTRGSELLGLRDRAETVGGRMKIVSDAGAGTSLLVTIPIDVR